MTDQRLREEIEQVIERWRLRAQNIGMTQRSGDEYDDGLEYGRMETLSHCADELSALLRRHSGETEGLKAAGAALYDEVFRTYGFVTARVQPMLRAWEEAVKDSGDLPEQETNRTPLAQEEKP